ncbi:MAG: hypothetical protein CMO81_01660 [Waddliaceae bacterium]|nr:hypothetical protein [Waddliaceae bacterium]
MSINIYFRQAVLVGLSSFCTLGVSTLSAEEASNTPSVVTEATTSQTVEFKEFTGRVTRNRVRLRSGSSLESKVVQEMGRDDLLIVQGEQDDFYEIAPPAGTHAYVFRTFVLDGIVEGDRVNVRLKPELESPVIAQLNTGDRVEGSICTDNKKWLEITPPESTRFYIAKEYVEYAGGPDLLAKMAKREREVQDTLNSAFLISQTELQKPFPDINLERAKASFEKVIADYPEFTEQIAKAEEGLNIVDQAYLQKKIAHLEVRARKNTDSWNTENQNLSEQLGQYKENLAKLEERLREESGLPISLVNLDKDLPDAAKENERSKETIVPQKILVDASWGQQEEEQYQNWLEDHQGTREEFYSFEQIEATRLTGIIKPYTRNVKNKPGDYVLVDEKRHMPIAYLYSTRMPLEQAVGKTVQIVGARRPNNHFAYPAYHVISFQ